MRAAALLAMRNVPTMFSSIVFLEINKGSSGKEQPWPRIKWWLNGDLNGDFSDFKTRNGEIEG